MNLNRLSTITLLLLLSSTWNSAALSKGDDDNAAENDVSIEKVTLVRDAGDKFDPVESFKPTDTFGVLVKLSEAKMGTQVKAIWMIVDAGGVKNKKIFEKEVTLTPEAVKGAKEPSRIDFTLSHDHPYPAGQYKTEIYLNTELVDTVEFEIE